jgi:hypothetical protein
MKGKAMASQEKIPVDRVKIVFFVDELNAEKVFQQVGYLVKTLECAIGINHSFGTAERCS